MGTMLTIAWDRDDVLNDLMREWFVQTWLPEHTACTLTYGDLKENPPHRILGVSRQEYLESLDRFRDTDASDRMSPLDDVVAWFEKNGARCQHLVLTATPMASVPSSSAWTFRHFGAWIRGFHFVPSPRPDDSHPEYDVDKGSCLKRLGMVDILVDDSPANIAAAAEAGIRTVLVPRPWNEGRGTIVDALAELDGLLAQDASAPIR